MKREESKIEPGWIVLITAWIILIIPIPGTIIIAGCLNSVALILAIILLAKNETKKGLILLLSGLTITPIIIFLEMGLFMAGISSIIKPKIEKEKINFSRKINTEIKKINSYTKKSKPTYNNYNYSYKYNDNFRDEQYSFNQKPFANKHLYKKNKPHRINRENDIPHKIYSWRDEKGIMHYSNMRPSNWEKYKTQ